MTDLPLSRDPLCGPELNTIAAHRSARIDWSQTRRHLGRKLRDLRFDSTSPSQRAIADVAHLHDVQH
jgi:hypothetical protein